MNFKIFFESDRFKTLRRVFISRNNKKTNFMMQVRLDIR